MNNNIKRASSEALFMDDRVRDLSVFVLGTFRRTQRINVFIQGTK